jgi:hypothetical protein
MNTKQKILDALGCTIEDISKARLIDVLLDAFKVKQAEIEKLRGENGHEREMMHAERELMKRDHQRMRSDPTYCGPIGRYFFVGKDGRKFWGRLQNGRLELFERVKNVDFPACEVANGEWERLGKAVPPACSNPIPGRKTVR